MADINKAALRNRVLQHLSVISATQTPTTEDQTLVEEAIDAAHSELRAFGAVPFPTSAIPDWAQTHLRNLVAFNVAPSYGVSGDRLMTLEREATQAEFKLKRQVSGKKHARPTPRKFY